MKLMNFCMIRQGTKVLVQDKPKKYGWEGLTFPGGKVEPGESFDAAVRREVLEETGLVLGKITFCGILQWEFSDRREVVFLYKTDDFTGTLLQETKEGALQWMEWDAFLEADGKAEFMDDYLRMLLDENLQEAYCVYEEGENNVFLFYDGENSLH